MRKEGILSEKEAGPAEIPDCIINFYDEFIVEDLRARKVWLIANGHLEEAGAALDRLEEEIKNRGEQPAARTTAGNGHTGNSHTSDFTKEEYLKAIQDMIDYIVEGDIYIANMTRQLMAAGKGVPMRYLKG